MHVGTGQPTYEGVQVVAILGPVVLGTGLEEIFCKLKGDWNEERRGCTGAEEQGAHQGHGRSLLVYLVLPHPSVSHHR